MPPSKTIELPIAGMDCVECTQHVQQAIQALPGIESVDVFLASEKAIIRLDPSRVDTAAIRKAVESEGYSVVDPDFDDALSTPLADLTRSALLLLGLIFGAVMLVVVVGEWMGLFQRIAERVPWPVGLLIVLLAGYPVFLKVIRAALQRRIIAHTLMSLGAVAALVVGEWATAVVVVFFMRIGDFVESFTTERARGAIKDLEAMAPRKARVERDDGEFEIPVEEVKTGDTVIVRPGERIPVDGEVIEGQATLDQSTITGESMPIEAGRGTKVFATALTRLGALRIRVTHVAADTTFGRIIRLVEEAEANRSHVERVADRFSAYYLPVVAGIAALTLIIRHDALATAAVLVVACSCSFALATPIAVLASIGAGAKRGLLIKGGRYLESLARADVLLIDKTGTLTLGLPQITDVLPFGRISKSEMLSMAASAEHYSEHPLAQAVREKAAGLGLSLAKPQSFTAVAGMGVEARVDGYSVVVGNRSMVQEAVSECNLDELEAQGKTLLLVARDGELVGVLAASDTPRPEVPESLAAIRRIGIQQIELLTGDNERSAASLAETLQIPYRANLLPEDKIAIVKEYQAKGHTVVMVGDGVNDAPALAQSDIGIAMGAAGTDVAIEAAHIALMRDDWALVPRLIRIARRTMGVVKLNIGFTTLYNFAGLSLASLGFLPPILAAAAQSLPDLGILANSSRLLRQK